MQELVVSHHTTHHRVADQKCFEAFGAFQSDAIDASVRVRALKRRCQDLEPLCSWCAAEHALGSPE